MKVIYTGLESSGKSLKLAMVVSQLALRNHKWFKKSGKKRAIASNLKFSDEFYNYVVKDLGIPIIYWENLDELTALSDCDVIIDEVGNYFDSRLWTDLSLDTRRWLTQGAKMGIELYGTAQDFAQVDKAFRRLVNELYYINKVMGSRRPSATKPPVKYIWGLCLIRPLDPQGYDEDKKKFSGIVAMPSIFTIQRNYCEIFDTLQKIKKSKPLAFKHSERFCELHGQSCSYAKVIHN